MSKFGFNAKWEHIEELDCGCIIAWNNGMKEAVFLKFCDEDYEKYYNYNKSLLESEKEVSRNREGRTASGVNLSENNERRKEEEKIKEKYGVRP